MNICKIYDGDYPWDVRVEKILDALIDHGHNVQLVCRNVMRRPPVEVGRGLTIHRLHPLPGRRFNAVTSFPAFFNPRWLARISRVVRGQRSDVIIVRDLPLALSAIVIGRRYGVPVLFDMAENYPAMLRYIRQYGRFKLADLFIRNAWAARAVEKTVLKHCHHVFVVTEENRQRLLDLGVAPHRVSVLMNTPRLRREIDIASSSVSTTHHSGRPGFTAVYVGGIDPGRGLEQVLDVIPTVTDLIQGFRFQVIGNQGGDLTALKRLARELRIDDHVAFVGWVDRCEVGRYIAQGDVGIIPHRVCSHTLTTLPNKLFDYMAYAKPVVASNMRPVRRILEAEGCGVVYERPDDLVTSLVHLSKHAETRKKMGDNGRRAVLSRYNWEHDTKVLADALDICLHGDTPRSSYVDPRA